MRHGMNSATKRRGFSLEIMRHLYFLTPFFTVKFHIYAAVLNSEMVIMMRITH